MASKPGPLSRTGRGKSTSRTASRAKQVAARAGNERSAAVLNHTARGRGSHSPGVESEPVRKRTRRTPATTRTTPSSRPRLKESNPVVPPKRRGPGPIDNTARKPKRRR